MLGLDTDNGKEFINYSCSTIAGVNRLRLPGVGPTKRTISANPPISKPEPVRAIDVEQHNEAISILELRQFIEASSGDGDLGRDQRAGRMYRRTKHPRVPHTWRTRKDPFEAVWPELKQRLEERPEMTAKVLFKELQERYPDQYAEGQLRTLQRRVRAWRMERAAELFER